MVWTYEKGTGLARVDITGEHREAILLTPAWVIGNQYYWQDNPATGSVVRVTPEMASDHHQADPSSIYGMDAIILLRILNPREVLSHFDNVRFSDQEGNESRAVSGDIALYDLAGAGLPSSVVTMLGVARDDVGHVVLKTDEKGRPLTTAIDYPSMKLSAEFSWERAEKAPEAPSGATDLLGP